MSKIERNRRVNNAAFTATQILRGLAYSLLESGFKRQDVAAALDSLAGEVRSDEGKKRLATRKRDSGGGS